MKQLTFWERDRRKQSSNEEFTECSMNSLDLRRPREITSFRLAKNSSANFCCNPNSPFSREQKAPSKNVSFRIKPDWTLSPPRFLLLKNSVMLPEMFIYILNSSVSPTFGRTVIYHDEYLITTKIVEC